MGKKGYGSCFGEDYQQYTKHIIKYVDNHFNNDKNIKILIPNALDGLHILCTARRGFKLDCYETQDEFINGGIIDNFNIIGLKEKLNYFNYNDKVNLYEKNFFEQKVEKEYDFLFCYKSLHLNCNKHIPKERKMRKLLCYNVIVRFFKRRCRMNNKICFYKLNGTLKDEVAFNEENLKII